MVRKNLTLRTPRTTLDINSEEHVLNFYAYFSIIFGTKLLNKKRDWAEYGGPSLDHDFASRRTTYIP